MKHTIRIGLWVVVCVAASAVLSGVWVSAQPAPVAPEPAPAAEAIAAPASVSAAPKNVIFMIADGCGFNQFLAGSYYEHGADGGQVYHRFPVRIAMSTYSIAGDYDPAAAAADPKYAAKGATDSAAAATAMSSGRKAVDGAIGMIPGEEGPVPVEHMAERAEKLGKATGVITSVPFSHATPAGFLVHEGSRGSYMEIARQMIHDSAAEVVMGAGHPWFDDSGRFVDLPLDAKQRAKRFSYIGEENWLALEAGKAGGDADGDGDPDPWALIQTRQGFQDLASGDTPARVFGLATVASTLQQGRAGDSKAGAYKVPLTETVPTLAEMTRAALNVLDNDSDGLFLMIEGGAIDWCGHANQSGRLVEEVVDFNRAVEAVVAWVEAKSNWSETLVIVTADHETGLLSGPSEAGQPCPLSPSGIGVQPAMAWLSTSHTNSLVPFFAKGAASDLLLAEANEEDPVRGRYIDNTEPAQVILDLWRAPE